MIWVSVLEILFAIMLVVAFIIAAVHDLRRKK